MAESNIVELQSRRNGCADELASVLKEEGKNMEAAILLHASSNGKLHLVVVGEINELEVLGWLQYAMHRFLGAE